MKKLLTSLPSTKPDQFFKSEISQNGILTNRAFTYQHQLLNMIKSMTKACRNRLVFLDRDIEVVYQENQTVVRDLLKVNCADELWDMFAVRGEISEEGQIKILISLLQELNERKMSEGDYGNVEKADQYRKVVEWLIPQIVNYEQIFMERVQKEELKNWEDAKNKRLNDFVHYQHKTVEQFQKMDSSRHDNLLNRFRMEHIQRQKQFRKKVEKEVYKINPSKLLQLSKEKSLYTKLGAYRTNKVNPYENKGLTKDLRQSAEHEQQRKFHLIEHLKRKEKEKMYRQQKTLNASQQVHADSERGRVMRNLTFQRESLSSNENIIKQNMRHSLHIQKSRKVNDLKKTLEHLVKHEDEAKISQIIATHESKIMHSNNILDVVATQGVAKDIKDKGGRYTTIDSYSIDKSIGRPKRPFERRLKDIFREERVQDSASPMLSGRKSLVDLYDKDMKLV